MANKLTVKDFSKFEVLFEGKAIPFSNVTITERAGDFPSATITVAASSKALKVLANTVVQIFGPDPITDESILLFEGNINTISYQSSDKSRFVNYTASSFLSKWKKVFMRPADSVTTKEYSLAAGESPITYYNLTKETSEGTTPQSIKAYKAITQAVKEKQKMESYGELKDALTELSFSQTADFADEFSALLAKEEVAEGDIQLVLEFFLRKFERHDPFFGIESTSFALSPSILAFPNYSKFEQFKRVATAENYKKLMSAVQDPFNEGKLGLIQGLAELLKMVRYTLNVSSAPTMTSNF